jgi:hypothetical protein
MVMTENQPQIKDLNAARGWLWIKQGWYLFKKSPLLLITLTLIATAIFIAVGSIPVVGETLSSLLFPVILSGMLWGCHALEHDEQLELAHLFAGFTRNTQNLVMLGAFNLLGNYLILGAMKLTGGAALVELMAHGARKVDPAEFAQALSGAGLAIVISLALSIILLMATQFAPMLVTFDKVSPVNALRNSLLGTWRNLAPLSVYGTIMIVLMIAATLALMLGWMVLAPFMITSFYAAYRGIFPWPGDNAVPVTHDVEN